MPVKKLLIPGIEGKLQFPALPAYNLQENYASWIPRYAVVIAAKPEANVMAIKTQWTTEDINIMNTALGYARAAKGKTFPNPAVGAVVVGPSGKVVGHGATGRWGDAHAEKTALATAGQRARGATLYVTLEPCCHFGKTPPCTDAIIAAGIKKVVVAINDPNPLVRGK